MTPPFLGKTRSFTPAFTIVELLIVVVVIAILASITIIAYNGVRQQAEDASIKSELQQLGKRVMSY
ncbi:hypothetical protein B7Z28_01170 [Candidatus Saccharibacteria bacterium 32-45-3]|nr:MAG: hypothetical protein B7Z28_01170 [Candidatus Saccharibacteria bacterium 32-45-3]